MLGLFYPYGFLLQAVAILHFVRRRPDTYWLFIILMGGAVGALAYIVIEVIPDAGLLRGAFQVFPRRKRIKELEAAVLDNPSIGNYEELGDLYLDDEQFARARDCFDRVIAKSDAIDPFYRRALCEMAMDDPAAAAADLEQVVARDPKYDYQRAAGLRAHALARIGEREKAGKRTKSPGAVMRDPLMHALTGAPNGSTQMLSSKVSHMLLNANESPSGDGDGC